MKIFKLTHVLGAALIGLASFSSCTDACKDVDCGPGTCLEGDCVCPDGYSGTSCSIENRAAFIGTFNVTETCSQSTDTYAVVIADGASATEVTISNIYNAGLVANATVNADGTLTIPSQTFGAGTVSGTVTKAGSVITINFNLVLGSDTDTCSAVSQ
jgi:hypothetical protein